MSLCQPNLRAIALAIPRTNTFAVKPNYVLQQNPIYRSFYQAYLDYLKRRSEKENIWGFRQALLVDVVTILFIAALLNLEGSYIHPTASINISSIPNCGRYLLKDVPLVIHCVLQTAVFTFEIFQPKNPKEGDLELKVKIQSFMANISENPKDKIYTLPIWIFWYKPTAVILESLDEITTKDSICIYLYERPTGDRGKTINDRHSTLQLPHPIEQSLEEGIKFLTTLLCQRLGRYVI